MKPPLIIIGMHRSGTSYLSRVLMDSGYFFGYWKDNQNESLYFKNFNNQLLQYKSATWDRPIEVGYNAGMLKPINRYKYYGSLKRPTVLLRNLITLKKWGWKDPRNTFTLKYWLHYYPNAKVIHIYRNGVDVSHSLYIRNSKLPSTHPDFSAELLDPKSCFELWNLYVNQAFKNSHLTENFLSVKYEELTKGNGNDIGRLESFLKTDLIKSFNSFKLEKRINNRSKINEFEKTLGKIYLENKLMKVLGYAVTRNQ